MLTKIGIAKFIAARASGNGINLKRFKLSSQSILPNENITTLEGIVYEANINSKYVDEENDCYVNLECVVPSNVGGFEINAIGIYDEENHLIALGNLPPTYKPRLEQGSAKELLIKVVMELKNASEVVLELNPSVVLASRDFVNKMKLELNLRIDAEVERFTQELKKYALKNGDSTQNFQVADAKNPNDAINKKQLDAMQKKAQELDAALEQKMQTTIKQTIETSTIAGARLKTSIKPISQAETGVKIEPVKEIIFYKNNATAPLFYLQGGTFVHSYVVVNGVTIVSNTKTYQYSCNNNNGG